MMIYIEGTDFKLDQTAVTLGKFDGIHLGHQLLLQTIWERKDLTSVMFTFDLHPGNLFSDQEIKLLDTPEERIKLLSQTKLSYLIAYPFTRETAAMEPEFFVRQILQEQLGAKLVVVGEDFHFGHKRAGDVALLQKLSAECGFEVIACPKVVCADDVVGSTRIRALLQEGRMEEVRLLLGRAFSVTGTVIHGNQLGRTVGMPTANIRPDDRKILPPNGVYVSDVLLDGNVYRGITNVGYKPTVGGEKTPGVETWIFDFEENLYDRELKVELLHYVRPERKFASLAEVKRQVEQDAEIARTYQR